MRARLNLAVFAMITAEARKLKNGERSLPILPQKRCLVDRTAHMTDKKTAPKRPPVELWITALRLPQTPVRALRLFDHGYYLCQNISPNPPNARKGITTDRLDHRVESKRPPNPPNARKGITTMKLIRRFIGRDLSESPKRP